jgi:hypothetical protein
MLLALVVSAPTSAQQDIWGDIEPDTHVIITLRTGERYQASFVEARDSVIVVRIGSVDTRLARADIRSIVTERPPIERYREMRALVDDEDVDRLLVLVDWLRAQGLFGEALDELANILEVEPGNGDAIRLQSLTSQQKTLADEKREGASDTAGAPRSRRAVPANRPDAGVFPVISEEDANLVKVYEIDIEDPPRLLIEHETIRKLITRYGGIASVPTNEALADEFYRLPPEDILRNMFDARARDLYREVRVLDLPDPIRNFRDNVNSTWVVNTCGTTTCHGGLDSGEFLLFNRAQNNERSAITNLLILERFRTSGGESLINYEFPEDSLLLHYAMPISRSAKPHPQVRGFRPAFRSEKSRRYVQAIEWMNSMHRPRIDYPVEFTPPRPSDFALDEAPVDAPASEPNDR